MVLEIIGALGIGAGFFTIVGFALYQAIQELKEGYYIPIIIVGSISVMLLGLILVAVGQTI